MLIKCSTLSITALSIQRYYTEYRVFYLCRLIVVVINVIVLRVVAPKKGKPVLLKGSSLLRIQSSGPNLQHSMNSMVHFITMKNDTTQMTVILMATSITTLDTECWYAE